MKRWLMVLAAVGTILVISLTPVARNNKNLSEPVKMTFEGKIFCPATDLKNTYGARSACIAFGTRQALRLDDGSYLYFLENRYSTRLINDLSFSNKEVKVFGTFYPSATMIDIDSFLVNDRMMVWSPKENKMSPRNLSGFSF